MVNTTDSAARLGLRERKKVQTRETIAETAKSLFDERGFDNVTTAEIADAANVSVKTLFKYFATKEDLLFSDENELRDQILEAVRDRPAGESALDGVRHFFQSLISERPGRQFLDGLEGLRRTFEGNSALQGRLTLMWERYEIALASLLSEEAGLATADPSARLVAAQIISLFRLLTSDELRIYLNEAPARKRGAALEAWIERSLELVGNGVQHFAVRSES